MVFESVLNIIVILFSFIKVINFNGLNWFIKTIKSIIKFSNN